MTDQPATAAPPARLPWVDEPAVYIGAELQTTWSALTEVLRKSFSRDGRAIGAALLGCEHVRPTGPIFPQERSVVPGFLVATSRPPLTLGLVGRHRLSAYSLTFRLDEGAPGTTDLRAETRAAFPGFTGRVYRAAVIDSGAHRRLVISLLHSIKTQAESRHGS